MIKVNLNLNKNCRNCSEYKHKNCNGEATDCLCKNCPVCIGKCIITKYCTETESVLDFCRIFRIIKTLMVIIIK